MIQQESYLKVADNTGAKEIKTIRVLGLAPEILHRVGSAASVGLDSLPHNGAVITLLTICGQSHKESYKYIFFPTVVFTLAGMFLSIALGTVLYPIS